MAKVCIVPADNELLKELEREEPSPPSRVTTARPPQLPAIVVTPHSQPGIRSKARLFESDNKPAEEEEKDFYDEYYDYYDQITEQENKAEENRASQVNQVFRPTAKLSTFPPPEERFAAIEPADITVFRKSSNNNLLINLIHSIECSNLSRNVLMLKMV